MSAPARPGMTAPAKRTKRAKTVSPEPAEIPPPPPLTPEQVQRCAALLRPHLALLRDQQNTA